MAVTVTTILQESYLYKKLLKINACLEPCMSKWHKYTTLEAAGLKPVHNKRKEKEKKERKKKHFWMEWSTHELESTGARTTQLQTVVLQTEFLLCLCDNGFLTTYGHAIAQAVRHWLLITETQVQSCMTSSEIHDRWSGTGACFSMSSSLFPC
jgi:hypothetical protein